MLAQERPQVQRVRVIDDNAGGIHDAPPGRDPAETEIAILGGGGPAIVAWMKSADIVETFGRRREIIRDSHGGTGSRLQVIDNVLRGLRIRVVARCVDGAAGYQTLLVERECLRVAGKPVWRKLAVVVGENKKTPASPAGAGVARHPATGMRLRDHGKRRSPGGRRQSGVRLEVLAVEDDDRFPERRRIILLGERAQAIAELTVAFTGGNDYRKEWRFAHQARGLLARSAANRRGLDSPISDIPQASSENGASRKQVSDWRKPRRRSPARK